MVKLNVSMKQTKGAATEAAVKERLTDILAEVPFANIRRWAPTVKADGAEVDFAVDLVAAGVPWRLLVEVKETGEPRVVRGAIQQLQTALAKRTRQ